MNVQINIYRLLPCICITLFVAMSSGCDTDSGAVIEGGQTNPATDETYVDFDLDAIDSQIIESRDPGPSLGFALPPNGRIFAQTGAVGSIRGAEFTQSCTDGKVLAGVSGFYNDRINQLQALCVSANSVGAWIDSPTATTSPAGSANGQSFSRICPSDHAVVGFTSDFANDYPAYLEVHCAKLDSELKTQSARVILESVGDLGNFAPSSRPQCAVGAASTGLYGHAQSAVERLGLTCYEDPAFAGRWSSRIDWPHIAIHNVVLSDGKLLTYGTGGSGIQGAMEFNIWDPSLGIGQSSHKNIQGTAQVDSFCSAATMLPDTGNVLVSGGDARPIGNWNSGIRDATLYNAASESVGRANDMNSERWYPTSTSLANGDIVVSMGRDSDNVKSHIPEIYSAQDGTWRPLNNANMSAYQYFYPRQFLAPDGRVFGVSGRSMYFMTTDNDGSITDAGTLPVHSYGTSTTAAMFEPGKILQAGGISYHGLGAIIIDVTSGAATVTRTEDLAQPRRAWSTTVLLADGKVMMVGGSYELNDDVTASLGAETWDPQTGKWSQYSRPELARLYHSTAVLLMDGRVLVAGGGSPGPLNNRNAEIFSPPYLFDASGALASRPEITYAPDKSAWGQSIGISTNSNADISRVTLVKTGATTHGFNMDQRFLELAFSNGANQLSVTMPATGNVAPHGYYMLFVHDANGTPSLAKMINLGSEAAPDIPPIDPDPDNPPPSANSLLSNGGFEQGKQAWIDCAASTNTTVSTTRIEGGRSMQVRAGGCLYQEILVEPGANYALNCHARGSSLEYSSLSLQMLDQNYTQAAAKSVVVGSSGFESQSVNLLAPANAHYASVTLYSEGTALFDRCELVQDSDQTTTDPVEPPVTDADNLISNGNFEQGKSDWNDCSQPGLTSATADSANGAGAIQIQNSGCLYQEFPVTPGKQYQLSCASKSAATRYSSMSLTLMNESYTTLTSDYKPVGQNIFQIYKTTLFTPIDGRIGAVTLYSEDTAQFDDCSVVEL